MNQHNPVSQLVEGPFDFERVILRVFPLKARMHTLERFCRTYLNVAPDIAYFRPSLPYVFMMAASYPFMSPEASSVGWVSQNEVLFVVPLEWYDVRSGKRIFRDWAMVSPFIFVDNEVSTASGREVYGWPKVFARLSAEINPWMKDPRAWHHLMTLETMMFSELYAGKRLEQRVLMEIERKPPPCFSELPLDLNNPLNPLLAVPEFILGNLNATGSLARGLGSLFAPRGEASPDDKLRALLSNLWKSLGRYPPKLFTNNINLKQFRSSEPYAACYQALTNSRMEIRGFRTGALLGDDDILRGDPAAGFRITIHQYDTYPIVESLGLMVEEELEIQGKSAARLLPVLPFWLELDLRYELGKRICFTANILKDWVVEDGTKPKLLARGGPLEYVTPLGAGGPAVQGPFKLWDTTLHMLPLKVKDKGHTKLDALIAKLDKATSPKVKFTVLDHSVFLVVTSYGKMSSEANNLGWWAEHEVAFAVPIQFTVGDPPDCRHKALFWPFLFADSPIAVTTGREVLGLPIQQARLSAGVDPWMEQSGVLAKRRLIAVKTNQFAALHAGLTREERVLLEINKRDRDAESEQSPKRPDGVEDACRKKLIDWLEKYCNQTPKVADGRLPTPLHNLTLKQFPDIESPDRPCYQAVVHQKRYIGRWSRPSLPDDGLPYGPLEGDYEVKIHEDAENNIVASLGLEVDAVEYLDNGTRVQTVKPFCPFWAKVDVEYELAETLFSKVLGGEWERTGEDDSRGIRAWIEGVFKEMSENQPLDSLLACFPTAGKKSGK